MLFVGVGYTLLAGVISINSNNKPNFAHRLQQIDDNL